MTNPWQWAWCFWRVFWRDSKTRFRICSESRNRRRWWVEKVMKWHPPGWLRIIRFIREPVEGNLDGRELVWQASLAGGGPPVRASRTRTTSSPGHQRGRHCWSANGETGDFWEISQASLAGEDLLCASRTRTTSSPGHQRGRRCWNAYGETRDFWGDFASFACVWDGPPMRFAHPDNK